MKTYIFYVLVCLLMFSCKENTNVEPIQEKTDGYIISGTAPGLYNGIRAYLRSTDERGSLKDRDTAIIMNETFVFKGKVDSTEVWYMEVNSLDGSLPFVIDNANLTVTVDRDDILKSNIVGNSINNTISDFNTQLNTLNDSLINLRERYREMITNKESVAGMSDKVIALKDEILRFPHEFIKNNPDNPYGLSILNLMIRRNAQEKVLIIESFDALNEDLKKSSLGKNVVKGIPGIRKQYDIISATNIGKVAPNFSAPSPSGKTIELNAIKGKVTFIHFWSSWFKASRRENKRLTELYETYHGSGLEMIGVSLDGNSNQTHPKSDWKKAIKEDQLIWHQISNLNYFNDTISKAYNVRTLPASFLLDSNGVIVGKNLSGTSLEEILKALLLD